jgi:hypothetical protein
MISLAAGLLFRFRTFSEPGTLAGSLHPSDELGLPKFIHLIVILGWLGTFGRPQAADFKVSD